MQFVALDMCDIRKNLNLVLQNKMLHIFRIMSILVNIATRNFPHAMQKINSIESFFFSNSGDN